jgi:hypothetical protein
MLRSNRYKIKFEYKIYDFSTENPQFKPGETTSIGFATICPTRVGAIKVVLPGKQKKGLKPFSMSII